MKPKLLRCVIALLAGSALLLVAEFIARRGVPQSQLTPYRTARIEGLPAELRPSFETLWQGAQVHINSSGFRGPEFSAPQPDVLRIALVGDSFAFGSGVEFEDTLGARLELALAERGQPALVLNCGVPGYNAGDVATNLETYVLPLEPHVVVYLAFANDTDPPLRYGEIDPTRVPDTYSRFPMRSAFLEWCSVNVREGLAMLGMNQAKNRPELHGQSYAKAGGERMRSALTRMQALCTQAELRLVLAIHPFMFKAARNPFLQVEQGMARDGDALGLEVVPLDRAFEGRDRRALWADPIYDSHPNGEANGLSAAWLAGVLMSD
ncbi:MAG: hypothetical protein ACI8QC_000246 [Planctomycetota bacterium]|jgi:hypothetical protein